MYTKSNANSNENKGSIFKQKPTQDNKQLQQDQQNLKIQSRQTKRLGSQILNKQISAFANTVDSQTKDNLIYTNFFQKFTPSVKICPIYLVHKIQQSKPYYTDNLINKQIIFDVILEKNTEYHQSKIDTKFLTQKECGQETRIKNCIASSRPNSQIYKRLSKKFFQNIKNGIDQCMIYIGSQNAARLETSIGNANNPGMFMIVAIAVLDEKYKQNYQKFDIQMSFLQYRNQKMYDLLNYTQKPLKLKQKQNAGKNTKVIQFGQLKVKICTFLQFIKHFKIALFNNKQRDFRDQTKINAKYSNKHVENSSTFIMKIKIKRYNGQSQMIYQSETTLIDFEDHYSCKGNSKKSNHNLNENNSVESGSSNGRSLIDYLLIEINNSNPYNKPIHYHMVQKNLLLALIKKYLRKKQHHINLNQNNNSTFLKNQNNNKEQFIHYTGGQIFVINSMTTYKDYYEKNIQSVKYISQCIGNEWQAYVYNRYRFNKYFNYQFYQHTFKNLDIFIKTKNYQLYKDFQQAKLYFIEQGKNIINWIKEYKNVILQYMKHKKDYRYLQNLMVAYQIQLIGNCIKSDNFKDFYTSKIYLSLPRQLQIKTENIKQDIKKCLIDIQKAQQKYILIRKKQIETRKASLNPPSCLFTKTQSNQNNSLVTKNLSKIQFQNNNSKFKPLSNFLQPKYQQFNGFQEFLNLRKYILQFFYEIWSKINLTEERTITQQIIFQERFNDQIQKLKIKFKDFIEKIQKMDDDNIKCGKDEKVIDENSLTHLICSLNKNTNDLLKFGKKINENSPFKNQTLRLNKKQNIPFNANYLPKINGLDCKFTKTLSINQNKRLEPGVFHVLGHINFDSLMVNPNKQND